MNYILYTRKDVVAKDCKATLLSFALKSKLGLDSATVQGKSRSSHYSMQVRSLESLSCYTGPEFYICCEFAHLADSIIKLKHNRDRIQPSIRRVKGSAQGLL